MANQKSKAETCNQPKVLTKGDILALDIATKTGFYSMYSHGTWDLNRKKYEKPYKAFRDKLIDYITTYGIRQIVAEDVNVCTFFRGMMKLSELRGILLEVCEQVGIYPPEFVNVSTLKKYATGNGKAKKDEMIRACKVRYGYQPQDDNEADACHLFHYFIHTNPIQ